MGWVIATKLHVPARRPGLVARPRLRDRLRGGERSRLVLVSAPAGFGKTTLLADWLAETAAETAAERSVVWLSLDPEDAEPAPFWTCVLAALQTAVPAAGVAATELLGIQPLPTEQLLTGLLNDLSAAPGELWLVLDDYHLVEGREVAAGMAFLLDHLPPQVHVVLSTRADPDLPLSRWRVRGELTEVRAADLRFTPDEVGSYLAGAVGPGLAPADVAALEARTEGWAAALQLAALSLQGRDDASGFIARFAGDDRYVVDYLVEEVLAHQAGPVRDFLLQTAVLDRLTGPLCDAVTGGAGPDGVAGSVRLVELERANLFLVPLDDRREWYRYHHLFADVLRARALAEQPDLVPVLHRRAGDWLERNDHLTEAIRHALAARDFDHATRLVELAVPAVRRHRQEGLLRGWLAALPDGSVRRSPVLSVFAGYLLMVSGDLAAVEERLDDAERALAAVPEGADPPWPDTDDARSLPATIAIFRASLAQARGDVAGTAVHARRALELAGPDEHLARGGAAGFLGLAAWAEGDVTTALDIFGQAVASLRAAGNLIDELNSTVMLAEMWLAAGRPDTARRICEQALARAEAHGDATASAAAELHVAISELDLEAGDLITAERHLEQAEALSQKASRDESRYRWFVARALLVEAAGDPEQAVALLDEAERLYRPGFFPQLRPIPAIRARVRIGRGDLAGAADWAAERGVSTTDDVSYLGEYDHLTLVRLRLAQHRVDPDPEGLRRTAALLDRLHDAAEGSGRAGSLPEIRQLQAAVAEATGEGSGEGLSERELQVLRLLAGELTGPQIAQQLFVSHNTLRTHTKHIFTKLDVTSRRAAVRRAHELGLL
jgi:LuxR family transcriptional regulator, maltose regulon positive regulatory protein